MSEPAAGRRAAREALLFLALLGLALLATWPLAAHLGPAERIADKQLDDHVYWWDFWWAREALLVRHVDPFFCPDLFAPHGASLVASPFALPLGVLSLPLQAWLGPLAGSVVAVKLFGLLLLALGGWGMSLFLRALGVPFVASVLAGLLFAFAPFRLIQLGRIHYLAGSFVPLFLHASLMAVRGKGGRWYAAAAAWFALAGAIDASLLIELVMATGALLLFAWRDGARFLPTTARLLGCGLAGTLLLSPLLVRFLAETRANSGLDVASRLEYASEPSLVQRILSPDLDGLLWYSAPELHEQFAMAADDALRPPTTRSAARLAADIYDSMRPPAPGFALAGALASAATVAIALVAIALALRERGAWAFVVVALAGFALALGPTRTLFGEPTTMPYGWLARVLPGMEAGRYPAAHLRLFEFGSACAAALGALRGRRWLLVAGVAAAAAQFALAPLRPFQMAPVAIEEVHERMRDDPTPGNVVELPPRIESVLRKMGFGQIVHGRPLMGGPLTRVPRESRRFFEEELFVPRCMNPIEPLRLHPEQLRAEVEENRATLARYGVRYVVLRKSLFEFDRGASAQLLAYLEAHGFAMERTREGHVLVRVAPE